MFEELSLNILDIAMNSLAAGARTIRIAVNESAKQDSFAIRISDDGKGMDSQTLARVLDRNYTTKAGRKKPIGLGIALLRQTSEMCDGSFEAYSEPGKGTSVTASMRLSHVDRPPLGDLNSTILTLCAHKTLRVHLDYRTDDSAFHFSSHESDDQRNNHEPRSVKKT